MSQDQSVIPLRLRDGRVLQAVRTGNNAAWLCTCSRAIPLLGYSDDVMHPKESALVICPDCGKKFRVSAPAYRKVPTEVVAVT